MPASEDLEKLVAEHANVIAAAIRQVCGKRFDRVIPDVRQEVHIALWKQLCDGKKFDRPASYVYKVALTTALRTVRRVAREQHIAREAAIEQDTTETIDSYQAVDRARMLAAGLDKVEPQYQRAVRAYLVGFNHVEVAELLQVSESVARHQVYRGIASLKAAMQELEAADDN